MQLVFRKIGKSIWNHPLLNLFRKALCQALRLTGYVPSNKWMHRLHYKGAFSFNTPNGKIYMMHTGKWIENELFWKGYLGYEPNTVITFLHKAIGANTIVDIGANTGLFALLANKANPTARVFAFEPSPESFDTLLENIKLNRSSISAFQCAVSNEAGTAQLLIPPKGRGNSYAATLSMSHFRNHQTEEPVAVTVPVTTLHKFLQENDIDRIDLLKIDAEGFEMQILESIAERLSTLRPTVVIEILNQQNGQKLMDWFAPGYFQYFNIDDEKGLIAKDQLGSGSGSNHMIVPIHG